MKKMSKKAVFFGNEKLATGITDVEPIIREAVQKAGFVIEQHVTGRLSELKPHDAQLAVLAAYGRIIPRSVLDEFPLGIINVHPSLLPEYRGPTPIEQAILDGEDKTGVSIIRLTAGMDEGPIYKQKSIALKGNESKEKLAQTLQQLGADLLTEVLPDIARGDLKPRNQPHPDRATYSRLLKKDDGLVDWSKSADLIERELRAYMSWPGSRTEIGGKEVILIKAHSVPTNHLGNKPGDIDVVREPGVIMVECGRGSLCIERLKPAGKKEMSAPEFIRGYSHLIG